MRIVSETELGQSVAAHLRRNAARQGTAPRIIASGNAGSPFVALHAIDVAVETYRLFVLNAQPGLPVRDGVIPESPFIGPGFRTVPALNYLPARLSLVPRLFKSSHRPDVVVLHTSTPVDGKVSLGIEVNILPAAIEAARAHGGIVVAQVNPLMPYTYGDGEIDTDLIDLAIEAEQPLGGHRSTGPDHLGLQIGERVASLVRDGATLQLGIGNVPDATLASITDRRGLRVWTETFSDNMLTLDAVGALDPDTVLTTTFLLGSADLYKWANRNSRVRILRTETVNDPAIIATQPRMTSINTALQIDLYAQANASWIRGKIFSGFGGQADFVAGTLHAKGGRAIIALSSWHPKANVSTVLPMLTSPATSFQHSFIVTEQGVAPVWGCTQPQQTSNIINHAANPRVRDELTDTAGRLGLLGAATVSSNGRTTISA